jgi:hypothetical protein
MIFLSHFDMITMGRVYYHGVFLYSTYFYGDELVGQLLDGVECSPCITSLAWHIFGAMGPLCIVL